MSAAIVCPPIEGGDLDIASSPPEGNVLPNGTLIGGYKIESTLGQGGMGIVYRARQLESDREVALKMIKSNYLATEIDIARFRLEVKTVSRLHHPNIVPIYDVGEWRSIPYFTMKLIPGNSLGDRLKSKAFTPQEAAALVRTLAQAVHSAHQAGVLHRDLKPGNILISQNHTPFLTDFGLARDENTDSSITLTGQVLGTPSYLPPEQADYREDLVGIPSDIYSLGAIFYHLLTGQAPFKARSAIETLHQVKEKDVVRPRRIKPGIPRDLETIALKCLAKEPGKRFASASALAEDLERWRAGYPILARPVGLPERLTKWAKRQPAMASLVFLFFVTLIVATASVWSQWQNALTSQRSEHIQRTRAETALGERSRQLNEMYLNRSLELFRAQRDNLALAQLAQVLRLDPEQYSAAWTFADRARSGKISVPKLVKIKEIDHFEFARFLDDGTTVMGANRSGDAGFWDASTGHLKSKLLSHPSRVLDMVRSHDQTTTVIATEAGTVHLWDHRTGREQARRITFKNPVPKVLLTRDLNFLVAKTKARRVHIRNLVTDLPVGKPIIHKNVITALELSPDGTRLLTGSRDERLCLWALNTGELIAEIEPKLSWINSATFRRDGEQVLASFSRRAGALWNLETGQDGLTPLPHTNRVNFSGYSPSGELAFTCSRDFTVRVWDSETGAQAGDPLEHSSWVLHCWPSSDGDDLVTFTSDQRLHQWNLETRERSRPSISVQSEVLDVATRHQESAITVVTANGFCATWTQTQKPIQPPTLTHANRVGRFTVSKNGKLIASVVGKRRIHLWSTETLQRIPPFQTLRQPIESIAFRKQDSQLEVITINGDQHLFSISPGMQQAQLLSSPIKIPRTVVKRSPPGDRFVLMSSQGMRVIDPANTNATHQDIRLPDGLKQADFLSDGSLFLTVSGGDKLQFWNPDTWTEQHPPQTFHANIERLATTTDGRTIAIHSEDNVVTLLHRETDWSEKIQLRHTGGIRDLTFSEDSQYLATACNDRSAWVWNRSGTLVAGPVEHADDVMALALTHDNTLLATGSRNGDVQLWNVSDGHPLGNPWQHSDRVVHLKFTADSSRLISSSWDKTIKILPVTPPELPIPEWLPRWIEAAAGIRYTDSRGQEPVAINQLHQLNQSILEGQMKDSYARLIQALFTPQSTSTTTR